MGTFRMAAPLAATFAVLVLATLPARPIHAVESTVVVQPGDTLWGIASRNGVSVEQLATLNGLTDPNRIMAGQVLQVVPIAPAAPAAPLADSGTHVVRAGETLTGIALLHGTTVAELVRLNGIANPSFIVPGQALALPGAATGAADAAATDAGGYVEHVVAPGEHLIGIAAAYGTTVAALAEANGIANPSLIYAGSAIRIPAATATAAGEAAIGAPTATTATEAASGAEADSAMPEWMEPFVAERDPVRRLIVAEAEAFGVPTGFALAVAWQESGWQQSVVSPSGAIGVMQLLPSTAEWVSISMLGEPVDVHDTASNVRAGVRLLRHYLDRYDGDRHLALAAYYQGQLGTDTHGIYDVTRPYIASILYHEPFFED